MQCLLYLIHLNLSEIDVLGCIWLVFVSYFYW